MLQINFTPFPELETERLHLKQIVKTDAADIFKFRSDEEVMRFIPRPVAKTIEDAEKVVEMIAENIANLSGINWGIHLKEKPELIGIIGYVKLHKDNARAEVGYALHRDHHSKGIIHEALQEVLNYEFNEMKLNSVEALINPQNSRSINAIEKLNFKHEGHLREYTFYNNKFSDALIYSKLKYDK
ncbi:MAG: GNAT family N-acetyltransferase [Bacteroidetes bacterium]|nr:GNAT family N-acetyltransferase [Bacteroidota bacterium]